MSNRGLLVSHPVLKEVAAGRDMVVITVDGRPMNAAVGETLAAVLWANGIVTLGHDPDTGAPRGIFCGIGHCYACRVTVDGVPDVRSCLTPVRDGMCVALQDKETGSSDVD